MSHKDALVHNAETGEIYRSPDDNIEPTLPDKCVISLPDGITLDELPY